MTEGKRNVKVKRLVLKGTSTVKENIAQRTPKSPPKNIFLHVKMLFCPCLLFLLFKRGLQDGFEFLVGAIVMGAQGSLG